MIAVSYIKAMVFAVGTLLPTDPTERETTAQRYAEDIALAVGDDVQLARSVVATIGGESRFNPRIEKCLYRGAEADNGRAWGLGQIHAHWTGAYSKNDVCSDNRLSMRLVVKVLEKLRARSGGSLRRAMISYIGCAATDARAITRIGLYEKLRAIKQEGGAS